MDPPEMKFEEKELPKNGSRATLGKDIKRTENK